VNKALEVGAKVPVLITRQPAENFGMSALSADSGIQPFAAGGVIAGAIRLYTVKKVNNTEVRTYLTPPTTDTAGSNATGEFTARMCPDDDRYIEIDATSNAKDGKKISGVWIEILPVGGTATNADNWVPATCQITLTAVTKYPNITIRTDGSLNKALPNDWVTVTVTSPDGPCTIEGYTGNVAGIEMTGVSGKPGGNTAMLRLSGSPANKTYKPAVKVSVEGYKTAYENQGSGSDKGLTFSVKVADAKPKLKLSKKALVLAGGVWTNDGAAVFIESSDKNVRTEDIRSKIQSVVFEGNTIKEVTYDPLYSQQYTKSKGELLVVRKNGAKSGKGNVVVTFDGGYVVKLPLTLTMIDSGDLKVTPMKSAVTVHMNHNAAMVTDIPVTVNADNVFTNNWEIKHVTSAGTKAAYDGTHPHNDAFGGDKTPGLDNSVRLSVNNSTAMNNWFSESNAGGKNKKVDLHIGSSDIGAGKEFKVSVNMTAGEYSGSLKASNSGKINVADPNDFVTVTLTLKNTTSHIKDIDFSKGGGITSDFEPVPGSLEKDSFKVRLSPGRYANIDMAACTISPEITLENGNVISPALKLTPVFTKGKATQSAKAVTIYKGTPQAGADVEFGLTSPPGAELGVALINQASVDKLNLGRMDGGVYVKDVFELTLSGKNNYTLRLKDKAALPVQLPSDKVAASKSYPVQIELWAKGTYLADSFGNPINALGNPIPPGGKPVPLKTASGAPKTSPTLVTVKVDLK